VLNETGQVIGIATSRVTHIQETPVAGVSFVVPIQNAQAMLKLKITGWRDVNGDLPVMSLRDIVNAATPAVVYITWTETYLDGFVTRMYAWSEREANQPCSGRGCGCSSSGCGIHRPCG